MSFFNGQMIPGLGANITLAQVDEVLKTVKTPNGTIVSQNADFAEVAEWADGNPNNEDRTGYFVCANTPLNNIVMKKATSVDDVKGVSILAPAFAGNYSEDKVDSNGNLLPKYSFVAIIGFVPVIDNGTCTVGGRCMPDDNGCAIPSSNSMGYQVVNRIDEKRVLIIIEPNGDMVQRIKTKINDMQKDIENLETSNQALQEMASALSVGMSRKIVNKLPHLKDAEENAIYMVPNNSNEPNNYYDEFILFCNIQGVHNGVTITEASWNETETPFILKRARCLSWEPNDDYTSYKYTFRGWNNKGIETIISFTLPLDTPINRDFGIYIDYPSLYADFTILSTTELSAKVFYLEDFNNPYELIGSTAVDLTGYATTDYVDNAIGQALEGDY